MGVPPSVPSKETGGRATVWRAGALAWLSQSLDRVKNMTSEGRLVQLHGFCWFHSFSRGGEFGEEGSLQGRSEFQEFRASKILDSWWPHFCRDKSQKKTLTQKEERRRRRERMAEELRVRAFRECLEQRDSFMANQNFKFVDVFLKVCVRVCSSLPELTRHAGTGMSETLSLRETEKR